MDDKETQRMIDEGVPMVIARFDNKGNIISEKSYNMDNVSLSQFQTEQLAKYILKSCEKFYSDPENVKRYEEWKVKRDK